jgi:Tfp pilus assembly protein PilX
MSRHTNAVQDKNMNQPKASISGRNERGAALLIAIFSLLLISAVAIALIMMAGTESAISGNYRNALQAFYSAKAGLEEGRGRLWSGNANAMTSVSGFPTTGFLPIGQVWYITNPASGETVSPSASPYADTELASEYSGTPTIHTVSSVTQLSGTANAPYKWVRITATTEKSLNVDVDGDGSKNSNMELCSDGSQLVPVTALGSNTCPTVGANQSYQVYTVASLAVTPGGGKRLEEYTVAPQSYNLNFPGALTMAGPIGTFNGANSNPYHINGADGSGSVPVSGCTPTTNSIAAIDVTPGLDTANASGKDNQHYVGDILPRPDHYTGAVPSPAPSPAISGNPSITAQNPTGSLGSASALNQLVDTLKQNADGVMQPSPAPVGDHNNSGTTYNFGDTSHGWPSGMSASNPKVVVVDGSFDLGPNTGYGILVVTGNFTYHGNSGWNGIVLVIGDGTTTFDGLGGGNGEFDGAVFVATTRDSSGHGLSNFGAVNFDISGGGGNGIYYSSCWVNKVSQVPGLKLLSFKEITN